MRLLTASLLFISSHGLLHTGLLAHHRISPKLTRVVSLRSSNLPWQKKEEQTKVALSLPTLEQEPLPLGPINVIAASTWVMLVIYAFILAPGELSSASDNALLTKLISQPVPRPEEINEIWFAVWNSFVIVPSVIASLTVPTGKVGQRLPAAPFLWASGAIGYFALGPYFALRSPRAGLLPKSDLGWASRNIFEQRLFGIALAAVAASLPFSSDLFAPNFDFSTSLAGFLELASTSRFVSVASIDIVLMSIVASALIAEDTTRRGWEDKALPVAAATLILPVIGPAVYLAVRPGLLEE